MTFYQQIQNSLKQSPKKWLITGTAGFIGSNLLETLLSLGQSVVGLDNFSTGSRQNLEDVRKETGQSNWNRFHFLEGDIANLKTCLQACEGVDYVLHQAALGSVPRSIENPLNSHRANVDGFINMLLACRDNRIQKLVYASSSSVYGDDDSLLRTENIIGKPLSPYAATKYIDEIYAHVFANTYDMKIAGLRYFNVFGRRHNPDGPYAAVIPKWIGRLLHHETCDINGDGLTSRDFCYIDNVIQANLLAAVVSEQGEAHEVFNVACGKTTSLNQLYSQIRDELGKTDDVIQKMEPVYHPFRKGDIAHSQADISKASRFLHYSPTHFIEHGLKETIGWYQSHH